MDGLVVLVYYLEGKFGSVPVETLALCEQMAWEIRMEAQEKVGQLALKCVEIGLEKAM